MQASDQLESTELVAERPAPLNALGGLGNNLVAPLASDFAACVQASGITLEPADITLDDIRRAQAADDCLQPIMEALEDCAQPSHGDFQRKLGYFYPNGNL